MTTGSQARSYEDIVDALAEGLQALEETLAGLSEEDWARPTLLRHPDPEVQPWSVLELASHFDVFMGITLGLVGEAQAGQPSLDRVSFGISVSDSSQAPILYQYMIDHAKGHTPATMLATVRATFKEALDAASTTPPETIVPA